MRTSRTFLPTTAAGSNDAVGECAVGPQYAPVGGVDENQVVDRIEGVPPLRPGDCGAFEEPDILDRQAQKVGYVNEKVFLVVVEFARNSRSDCQQSQRRFLSGHQNEDSRRLEVFRAQAFPQAGGFRDAPGNELDAAKHFLNPGFPGRNSRILSRYSSLEAHRARNFECRLLGIVAEETRYRGWHSGFRPDGAGSRQALYPTRNDCVACAVIRASRRSLSLRSSLRARSASSAARPWRSRRKREDPLQPHPEQENIGCPVHRGRSRPWRPHNSNDPAGVSNRIRRCRDCERHRIQPAARKNRPLRRDLSPQQESRLLGNIQRDQPPGGSAVNTRGT